MFENGNKSGFGEQTYLSGAVYRGQWRDNLPSGEGVFESGGDVYDGEWVNGEREGKGRCIYISGDIYEGMWMKGLPHGNGYRDNFYQFGEC
jgi:hypothetical protein